MSADADQTEWLRDRIVAAAQEGAALMPRGSGSKAFYGRAVEAETLDVSGHRGIVHYEPTELMLTVRAGTPLAEIDAALSDSGQMLAFDPPHFGGTGTIGGAVAAGLSGPGRPFSGAVRDHVLGVRVIDGSGNVERFGGEVMKNVAGYDVSRLMAGSLGTLGVIVEVSLKVLPRPAAVRTARIETSPGDLYRRIEDTLRCGTPVTAAAHDGETARVRLAGAASAVTAGLERLGGGIDEDDGFWARLRDHELPFFTGGESEEALWRISLPPGSPPPDLAGSSVVDWAGQLFWLRTVEPAERVRKAAAALRGHATRLRGPQDGVDPFAPLPEPLMRFHRRLKQALDPAGILNPGRMYAEL